MINHPERIAAILLAAGESTRMGRPKQLLHWAGRTLIDWQVGQLQHAGAAEIVVVLGHDAESIRLAVPETARVVVNEVYREGRASSLRRGAEAIEEPVDALLILGVDQPRPAWLSRRLVERWRETHALIVSPRFPSGFGHPILVAGSLLPELRAVDEASLGLRAVIDRHVAEAGSIDVESDAVDVDLNTPEDYQEALAAFQSGDWATQL
ncbi:MAG: NTP transferase domain-containing protein [Dehalococcoidia bacterium]|nr:NTP transferase domain-containing protein [Dehalococcoidia bacterium]